MRYRITQSTAFPMVEISLAQGEQIHIERGCMVYHNGGVSLEGKMNSGEGGVGGFLKALGRSIVSGESIFITHAQGLTNDAVIAIAPAEPGSIRELQLGAQQWCINDSSFLACDGGVSYELKRQSFGNALFAGTGGFFVMETRGTGTMLVNSFGDIQEIRMDGSKPYIVDNNHVVAWTSSLNYSITVASGTFGFTTGEGLVNEFHGVGTILVQTRNIKALADAINPYIPKGNNSN